MTQKASIVVLGATGRLGRLMRPHWGNTPTVWQSRYAETGMHRLDFMQDPDGLTQLLSGASAVICLAGVTPAPDADMTQNVHIAQTVLDAAKAAGAGRVFLTSSAAVYGAGGSPLHENATLAPLSPYGESKRAMEELARAHPHPSTSLRIGNVAGADAILGKWNDAMALDRCNDGHAPRRSYIGVGTLARVLETLAGQTDVPQVVNVAAPGAIPMDALLDAANLPFSFREPHPGMIAEVALDTKRLETHVRFTPEDSDPATMVAMWRHSLHHTTIGSQ